MATSADYIEFVAEQLRGFGSVRYRKMFGEYMVYLEEKPVFSVCDNTVFVKELPQIAGLMREAECGFPYEGAKEMILAENIDDRDFMTALFRAIYDELPEPKPKKKK